MEMDCLLMWSISILACEDEKMKRRKKLTLKEALEGVRLATRVAREWEPKRVIKALNEYSRVVQDQNKTERLQKTVITAVFVVGIILSWLLYGCETVATAPILVANGIKESFDRNQTEKQEGHPYGKWIPLSIGGQPSGKIRFSNHEMIKVKHAKDL